MKNTKLDCNNSLLLIIDIQEKLIKAQHEKDKIKKNSAVLAEAANLLNIPVVVSEQYPEGLGPTIHEIKDKLPESAKFFEKQSFSCINSAFEILIKETGKKQIIVCGIESHICVYQTARDLLSLGFEVHIVKDAISSRKQFENETGIERMTIEGAIPTCTEMVLFELIRCSSHEKFRQIQSLIK